MTGDSPSVISSLSSIPSPSVSLSSGLVPRPASAISVKPSPSESINNEADKLVVSKTTVAPPATAVTRLIASGERGWRNQARAEPSASARKLTLDPSIVGASKGARRPPAGPSLWKNVNGARTRGRTPSDDQTATSSGIALRAPGAADWRSPSTMASSGVCPL
jgi:hypothetical protein